MGFWGKAVGAGLGFMIGGPIGAIFGAVVGHSFDGDARQKFSTGNMQCPHCGNQVRMSRLPDHCPVCGLMIDSAGSYQTEDRQFVFYVALASLAAKMAKADGQVTHDEIAAFDTFVRTELGLSGEERKIVADIFNEAKASAQTARDLAVQFRDVVGYQPQLSQMLIHLLFRISMADGHFHPDEEKFIEEVAGIIGVNRAAFDQIRAVFIKKDDQAYAILGISKAASDEEIKRVYKDLVRQYHPDKIIAQGLPEDFIKIANQKTAEINQAYDMIRKQRNF